MGDFSWVGSQEAFIDKPSSYLLAHLVVGRYGGNSEAGQNKNEDGCLVWFDEIANWEFVIILDVHQTAESAEIIIDLFNQNKTELEYLLSKTIHFKLFKQLEEYTLSLFLSDEFISFCRQVKGETSCLIVVRKEKYVWWFSVGDCVLYLFHPELTILGQYQLNQRQFYEWIGQVNTFDSKIPCYSSGTRELRQGINHLLLTTDGLIECPNDPFKDASEIFKVMTNSKQIQGVQTLLLTIKENNVKDSTTIVSWKVNILEEAVKASNQ
ncbi:protein phosphatase 2C domain-containing protein [Bacillus sp. JJ722]|uniref:protein phosphatase 2C domain-containing protein n=1 Tax=Bacillus sp. JJ722 TaxID=3122973 RepID=UPI0030000EB3